MKNYYSILGVEPTATYAEVKRAYHLKLKMHHADKNPNDPLADSKVRDILEAWETLSDSSERAKYDIKLKQHIESLNQEKLKKTRKVFLINFNAEILINVLSVNDPNNFNYILRREKGILDYKYLLATSFLVVVNGNVDIRVLKEFVKIRMPNKRHFITEIDLNNFTGQLPKEVCEWINKHKKRPIRKMAA